MISNKSALLLGILILLLGSIFYVFFRPATYVYFLPDSFLNYQITNYYVLILSGSLPSFIHVLAFSLVTAGFLPKTKHIWLVCLFWVVINIIIEIAQHAIVYPMVRGNIPQWENIPILENVKYYFARGTYDPVDLLFTILGGLFAFLILKKLRILVRISKGRKFLVGSKIK